jgi:hypothetical protein
LDAQPAQLESVVRRTSRPEVAFSDIKVPLKFVLSGGIILDKVWGRGMGAGEWGISYEIDDYFLVQSFSTEKCNFKMEKEKINKTKFIILGV